MKVSFQVYWYWWEVVRGKCQDFTSEGGRHVWDREGRKQSDCLQHKVLKRSWRYNAAACDLRTFNFHPKKWWKEWRTGICFSLNDLKRLQSITVSKSVPCLLAKDMSAQGTLYKNFFHRQTSMIVDAKISRLVGWKVPSLQDGILLRIVLLSLH